MKKILRFLCALTLVMSFAACTEKETENNDNKPDGDNNNYSTLLVGTWQVERMTVDGQNMTPPNMTLAFYNNGRGLMSDGGPDENNDFGWVINGNSIKISTHNHDFTFTIDYIDDSICDFHGDYIEFDGRDIRGDIRFHIVKSNGDNPGGDPNPGDLGIGTAELVESTESSITVRAHVTGSVDEYLGQFPNYTCGLIWCPASAGIPTMTSNNAVCNTDSYGNFEYTLNNLTARTAYNIIAWLKLTPDSEPILSYVRTYETAENGDSDTNWINIESVNVASSTSLSITVTGYFDDNPIGIGAVYNTTGNPTLSDQVYNAFEHLDTETGEIDETILGMDENPDGSRTVTVLLGGLQPGTTYYIRGFIQFGDGTPTIYTDEVSETTSQE